DATLHAGIADALGHAHGRGSGQSHIAFACENRLAGEMHGDQRCRTRGLHVDAWAGKVEFVRNSRARKILVVAEVREVARGAWQVRAEGQSIDEVAAHDPAYPREDSDRPGRASDGLPGSLDPPPCSSKRWTWLRTKGPRFRGQILKEGSVNLIDTRQQWGGLDMGRTAQRPGRYARRYEIVVAQRADRFHPFTEVSPEGGVIGRAGKPAGDADNRNTGGAVGAHHLRFLRARLV